jgi:DNA (cytosine-5)-methyltransferase 1
MNLIIHKTDEISDKLDDVREIQTRGSVVDLFCGAGGLTHGFLLEGFSICAGIDIDKDCRYPYERNNDAKFINRNVAEMNSSEIASLFKPDEPRILVGCAPCQPFSTYNQKNDDPNWQLLSSFGKVITEVLPDIVSMENVPRLVNFHNGEVLSDFTSVLEREGYTVSYKIVYAPDYGVPQQRTRLVLLASRHGLIELEAPTHSADRYVTVENAIKDFPPLAAGEADPKDPMHRVSGLSEMNLRRIRKARPGGSWRDWEPELITECHKAATGRGYASVYGRMRWGAPSPTITTQFYGFGNGRFGHPEQDRALSLREGAVLQSFPRNYEFVEPQQKIYFANVGKLIGNAVPVLLAQAIARSIKNHLEGLNDY